MLAVVLLLVVHLLMKNPLIQTFMRGQIQMNHFIKVAWYRTWDSMSQFSVDQECQLCLMVLPYDHVWVALVASHHMV